MSVPDCRLAPCTRHVLLCSGALALVVGLGLPAAHAQAPDDAPPSPPIRPDPRLTPGEVLTQNPSVLCHPGYARSVRHTSGALKHKVYLAYGLDAPGTRTPGRFEVDHLVPLSLGGSDTFANAWPESRDTEPWNADVKDRLEWHLLNLVCDGDLPVAQAQQDIARDWIAAYRKYCPSDADCPSYAATHGGLE